MRKHEFTQPFQLRQDPSEQDSLTTWVEFLGYEYKVNDDFISSMREYQQDYDNAWKLLIDSDVLFLSETAESICARTVLEEFRDYNNSLTIVEKARCNVCNAKNEIQRAIAEAELVRVEKTPLAFNL